MIKLLLKTSGKPGNSSERLMDYVSHVGKNRIGNINVLIKFLSVLSRSFWSYFSWRIRLISSDDEEVHSVMAVQDPPKQDTANLLQKKRKTTRASLVNWKC